MPILTTDDSVRLHYEETGSGTPIVFVHEFAGDSRSWEPQVRYLSRRYRCIAYNARGYPPSEVPADPAAYSQDRARDDVLAVLDGLAIERAHVVGLSMGGFATLHFGLAYPHRALSLTLAGVGYGAEPAQRTRFRQEAGAPPPSSCVPAPWRHSPSPIRSDPPGCSSRTRTQGAGESSPNCWRSIPRPDRPTPSRESRRNVLRSSISPIE